MRAFIESLEPWISIALIVIGLLILTRSPDCAVAFYPDDTIAETNELWT